MKPTMKTIIKDLLFLLATLVIWSFVIYEIFWKDKLPTLWGIIAIFVGFISSIIITHIRRYRKTKRTNDLWHDNVWIYKEAKRRVDKP